MKFTIFNGSPRKKKSNSKQLIDHFLMGCKSCSAREVSVYYIKDKKTKVEQLKAFAASDIVLIIFPLYADSMPGIVKEFFERIAELPAGKEKKIGFIVQSGFPEAIHSVYIERYLKKMSKRLNYTYIGTIIKGGVEGIQVMPEWMTKKVFKNFEDLGRYFGQHKHFSPSIKKELQKPMRLSPLRRAIISILSKSGITNFYWNGQLKKNEAFEKRFDKPYQAE